MCYECIAIVLPLTEETSTNRAYGDRQQTVYVRAELYECIYHKKNVIEGENQHWVLAIA